MKVDPTLKSMLIGGLLLALFAVVGTGLVALTWSATAERIALNERQALLQNLHALVPPARHDNDLFEDRIEVSDPALGTTAGVTVYRARAGDDPVAVVLSPVAPNGYGGTIRLLVAVNYEGSVAGVRVVKHQETPGLGDKIEADRSDWIRSFDGLSLGHPPAQKWAVRKDGGIFDQFTGATITPRAVVSAVRDTLSYYQAHRDELFTQPAAEVQPQPDLAPTQPVVEP